MELRRRNRDAGEASNEDVATLKEGFAVADERVAAAPSSETEVDAVVGAAVRGGSLLMLLAFIQRTSTFVLNVLLQRAMLSPSSTSNPDDADDSRDPTQTAPSSALEAYGAAAITLELISSSALFLAREPFRVALARSRVPPAASQAADAATAAAAPAATASGGGSGGGGGGGGSSSSSTGDEADRGRRSGRLRREAYRRRFVNTAWMSAPVGLAFAALVRLTYPWVIRNNAFAEVEENRQAASLVCFAAAVELLCEPLALIFQFRLLIDVRVKAEAAAVLVLGVSRYLLVTRAGMGILSFGYAQLLHSATLATAYVLLAVKDVAMTQAVAAGRTAGVSAATTAAATTKTTTKATTTTIVETQPPPLGVRAETERPGGRSSGAQRPEAPAAAAAGQGFARVRGWLPRRPNRGDDGAGGDADGGGWVDYGQLRLAGALAGQTLLKHVLTEGDKIVLARATSLRRGCGSGGSGGGGSGGSGCSQSGSLYEQGVYAIASGYGSLAARLLFQPLEEAARLMFSKLGAEEARGLGQKDDEGPAGMAATSAGSGAAAAAAAAVAAAAAGAAKLSPRRSGTARRVEGGGQEDRIATAGGGAADDGGRPLRERMAALLATLLKLVLTAGLVFVCFGFHYTETLLRLLLAGKGGGGGGSRDNGHSTAVSEVARVLSWYCVYVLFLAANGMCEAFAYAVARGGQLTGMSAGLVASFAAFWALVGPLTGRFGTSGLVMANAAGMACRVVCSAAFIRSFLLQGTTTTARPKPRRRFPSSSAGPPTPLYSPDADDEADGRRRGEEKQYREENNLWRQVVAGALPHPAVIAAMLLSSAAAFAASPVSSHSPPPMYSGGGADGSGGISWDVFGAAKHVGVGMVCFVAMAGVFARCEGIFLREVAALWRARRHTGSRAEEGRGGAAGLNGREKED